MLQNCSEFHSQNVKIYGCVFRDINGQNHGPTLKIQWFLERNLYGHPLAGLLWETQFEEILMELGWETVQKLECLPVHRKQGLLFVGIRG